MIWEGQTYKFPATFRTAAGVLTDPTTVTFRIRDPAGTETAYVYGVGTDVVRASVGSFYVIRQLTTAGEWRCRAEGTGTVAAVDELDRAIVVTASAFATAEP